MINNLKKHFNDALIIADTPIHMDKYTWFISNNGKFFGIEKNVLQTQEEKLLSSLFTPIRQQQSEMNEIQAAWYHYLFLNDNSFANIEKSYSNCRFIHFHTSQPITDKQEFQIALEALLPIDVVLLWETDVNGVIIETNLGDVSEEFSFEEIVDTFTSDFYVDIHLFIGHIYPFSNQLQAEFQWEKDCFSRAIRFFHKQKVYRLHDVLPYIILEGIDLPLRERLKNVILQELQGDQDLLDTIKVFFESNLNVSNASKQLYMHRNSLQYRIDKFIEKTGVDIKHFKGAVTIYLAILCMEHF